MRRPSPFGPKPSDGNGATPGKTASAASPTSATRSTAAASPSASAASSPTAAATPKHSLMPPIQGAAVKRTSPRPIQAADTPPTPPPAPRTPGSSGLAQRGTPKSGGGSSFHSSGSSEWPPRSAPRHSNLLSPSTHASGAHTTPHRIHSSYTGHAATSQRFHLSPQHAASSPLQAVSPTAPSSARPTTGRSGLPSRPGTAAGGAATAPSTLAKPRTPFLPSFTPNKQTPQQQPQPLFPSSPLLIKPDSVGSDRSDSPTQAAALALLHGAARLSAAEMRSQNAMASPLLKPRSAQSPSKRQSTNHLGSPQTNGRSFQHKLDTPGSASHNSILHGRSPSGALIPPASPMFVHAPSAEALKYDSLGLDGTPVGMQRNPLGSPGVERTLWPISAAAPAQLSGGLADTSLTNGHSFSTPNGSVPAPSPTKRKASVFVPLSSRPAPSPSSSPAAASGATRAAAASYPSVESLLAGLLGVQETDLARLVPPTFLGQLRQASGDALSRSGVHHRADANLIVYLSNLQVECCGDIAAIVNDDRHNRPCVSDAVLHRLVSSVEAAHASSAAQQAALGSFLDTHHADLGLDMAPAPLEVEALFTDSLGGRFTASALQSRRVARAAAAIAVTGAEPAPLESDSWGRFVEHTRKDVTAWSTSRAAEVSFLHAFLTNLRSGAATLILPPFSVDSTGTDTASITLSQVSQLLQAVCSACEGNGALLAGLTLVGTLRALAAEGAAFEDMEELQRHVVYVLEQAADATIHNSLQHLLCIAPEHHEEFESFLARMQDLGFSLSLLLQLAGMFPSPPLSLAAFERMVLDAAVRYTTGDASAVTCMLLQTFASDRHRPLLPSSTPLTTEQVQSLLGWMDAPRLLLCMERLALRPAPAPVAALYASFDALQSDLKFVDCERYVAEIDWIDSKLADLGVPEADVDRTRARLLKRFAPAMHQALAHVLPPPCFALRIFLSSAFASTLDASSAAFLSCWTEARSMIYSLLVSLPISSLASYLAPPPLLCSKVALRSWQIDQLLCRAGGDGPAALRTIMRMQQVRPRSLAGDWEAFAAAFSEAVTAAATTPPEPQPQPSESFSPLQEMLRLFIQAPQNRLLPAAASATITAAQLEALVAQLSAPITPPLPEAISEAAPAPSYALAFHYLLQLSSLDFDTDALCDNWESLLAVLHSARAETGHKEGQMLSHFSSATDCHLFLDSARPTPRNLVRFSRTVGCGRMGMQVFRVLGFETQATQKQAFALWMEFVAHARSKVAAEDGVDVRSSSTQQSLASFAEEVAAAVAASLPPEEEAPSVFSFSMQVTPPVVEGIDADLLARLEPSEDPRAPLLDALASGRSALVVRSTQESFQTSPVALSAAQMESLLTLASGSRTRLLTELSWLAANALTFDSFDSLLTHLAISAFDPLRCAKALNTAAHMLAAQGSVILSSSLRRMELTTLQVEQLREYCWIPSELLRGHLARLERRRRQNASPPLDSLAELALELRAVHTAFLEVRACESKLVAAFLQSPFLSPAVFPPLSEPAVVARLLDAVQDVRALPLALPRGCTEVDAAAGAGPAAIATVVILQHLASREQEKRVRAAAAATAAAAVTGTSTTPVVTTRAATHADLRELVLRCRSGTDLLNACNLHFRTLVDASSSSSSRLSESELFACGLQAAELLSYCWFWASSGKRFKSLRDLLRAASDLHELHATSAFDLSKFAIYTWLRAGSLLCKPTAISLALTEEIIIGLQPMLCDAPAPSGSSSSSDASSVSAAASKPSRAQLLQSACPALPLLLFFLQELQSVVRSFALPASTAAPDTAAATAFAMRSSDGLGHLVQVTPGLLGLAADRATLSDPEALAHFLGNFLQSFRRGRYAAAFETMRASLPLLPPEAAWTQTDWDALVVGSQGLLVAEMMQPMLSQLCADCGLSLGCGRYLAQNASQLVSLVSSLSRSFLRFESAFLTGFKDACENGGVLARMVNLQGVRASEIQLLQVFLAAGMSPSAHLLVPHLAALPSSQTQLQGIDDFLAMARSTSAALAAQRPPIAQWLRVHERALIDPSMPSAAAFPTLDGAAASDEAVEISPSSPLAAHASAAYSRDFGSQVNVTPEALDAMLLCEMAHPPEQPTQGLLQRLQGMLATGRKFPNARALCEAVQPQLQEAAFRKQPQPVQRVASSSGGSSASSTSSSAVAPASPPNGLAGAPAPPAQPLSSRLSATSVEFVDFQVPSFGSGSAVQPTSSLGSWSAAHASSLSSPFRNVAAAVLREDSSRIAALHAHLASATCPLWLAASRVQMDAADSPLMEALVRAGRGVQKTAELVHAFESQAVQFKDVEALTAAVEEAVREEMIAAGTMSAKAKKN